MPNLLPKCFHKRKKEIHDAVSQFHFQGELWKENFKSRHCFYFLIGSKTLLHQIWFAFSSYNYIWTDILLASTFRQAWNKILHWKATPTCKSKNISFFVKMILTNEKFKYAISFWFLISQKSFVCTRDHKLPFTIRVIMFLEKFTDKNQSHQILIKRETEVEINIEVLILQWSF